MKGSSLRRLAAQRQGARRDIRIQNHSRADTVATKSPAAPVREQPSRKDGSRKTGQTVVGDEEGPPCTKRSFARRAQLPVPQHFFDSVARLACRPCQIRAFPVSPSTTVRSVCLRGSRRGRRSSHGTALPVPTATTVGSARLARHVPSAPAAELYPPNSIRLPHATRFVDGIVYAAQQFPSRRRYFALRCLADKLSDEPSPLYTQSIQPFTTTGVQRCSERCQNSGKRTKPLRENKGHFADPTRLGCT